MKKLIGMMLSVVVLLGMSGCGVSLLGGRMINVYIVFSDDSEADPSIDAPSQLEDFSVMPAETAEKALEAFLKGNGAQMIDKAVGGTVEERLKEILGPPTETPEAPQPVPEDEMGFPTDEDAL